MINDFPSNNYQFIPGDGYLTIRLIGECDNKNIKMFEAELMTHLGNVPPFVVINCDHLSFVSKDWIRVFLFIKAHLKKYNKIMHLILVKPELQKCLLREGVDKAFTRQPNLREALVDFGLVSKKMLDTDFINPFLNATLHVLKVQASVESTAGKIFAKKSGDKSKGDVSGIIGIVSESFNGSVVISFPEKTFLKVMSGMLGEEIAEINQEIIDGAGEITNMIFGQAKIILNEKGYGIKTAIPSVVYGKDHSLNALTSGPIVVIPFTSNVGDFFVEICLSS